MEVSAVEGGFSSSKVEFQYQAGAVVQTVQPGSGPEAGVGVVRISGAHLAGSGEVLCGFGALEGVSAEVVSSALVQCEAPAHESAEVAVEVSVSDLGQQYSRSGAVYGYTEEGRVVGMEPWEGPQDGGMVVRVAMAGAVAGGEQCRFGSIAPVVGRRGGSGAEGVECQTVPDSNLD